MNKFILSIVAVMALAVNSFANGPVNGPFIKDDGVKFTTQSVGFQVNDKQLFVNYANDGKKDWFTVTQPGSTVPHLENYAGGLLKGTRYVAVVASNGKESRVSYGFEKQVIYFRMPVVNVPVTVLGQVFPTGFGGASVNNLTLSKDWSWGVRVGLKL
jgi:hypothetical protein